MAKTEISQVIPYPNSIKKERREKGMHIIYLDMKQAL